MDALRRLQDTRADLQRVMDTTRPEDEASADGEENPYEDLREDGRRLEKSLTAMEEQLHEPPGRKGIRAERDALSRVRNLSWRMGSSWDEPTPAQLEQLESVATRVQETLAAFNRLYAEEVAGFRAGVEEAGIRLFPATEPLSLP